MDLCVVLVDRDFRISLGLIVGLLSEGLTVFRQDQRVFWDETLRCDMLILAPSEDEDPGDMLRSLINRFPRLKYKPVVVLLEKNKDEDPALASEIEGSRVVHLPEPHSSKALIAALRSLGQREHIFH